MRSLVLMVVLLLGSVAPATSVDITFGTPGSPDGINVYPFNSSHITRYQQAYLGASFGTSSLFINAIGFYPRSTATVLAGGIFDFDLSYLSGPVSGLGSDLDANVTSAPTLVYSAELMGAVGTSPLVLTFASPFLFDPTFGNLLLDIDIDRAGYAGYAWVVGDGFERNFSSEMARAWTSDGVGNTDPTDHQTGLTTTFYTSAAPVPEPATMLLLASGLLGLAARRRRS